MVLACSPMPVGSHPRRRTGGDKIIAAFKRMLPPALLEVGAIAVVHSTGACRPADARRSSVYLDRAVATLAADAEVMHWSGQVLDVGDLPREYASTDVDSTQRKPFRMPAVGDGT
jgi:hypothetical protein